MFIEVESTVVVKIVRDDVEVLWLLQLNFALRLKLNYSSNCLASGISEAGLRKVRAELSNRRKVRFLSMNNGCALMRPTSTLASVTNELLQQLPRFIKEADVTMPTRQWYLSR